VIERARSLTYVVAIERRLDPLAATRGILATIRSSANPTLTAELVIERLTASLPR
jgi:hypothetical protein